MNIKNINIKEKLTSKKFIGVSFIVLLIIGALFLIIGMQTPITKYPGHTLLNVKITLASITSNTSLFQLPKSISGGGNYSALLGVALTGASILIIDLFVLVWFALIFFEKDIKKFIEKK